MAELVILMAHRPPKKCATTDGSLRSHRNAFDSHECQSNAISHYTASRRPSESHRPVTYMNCVITRDFHALEKSERHRRGSLQWRQAVVLMGHRAPRRARLLDATPTRDLWLGRHKGRAGDSDGPPPAKEVRDHRWLPELTKQQTRFT